MPHFFDKTVTNNGHIENTHRGRNFILNGGHHHRRTKSHGKAASKSPSSKLYEHSADESESGGSCGKSRFFEVYENQQR